jgi:hypothetical protein
MGGNIIELNPRKVFTVEDVNQILPLVKRITEEYSQKVQAMIARFEALKGRQDETVTALEKEINDQIQYWQNKLERLGIRAKGLWIADFDSGDGYFCWKYPEEKVTYWHAYKDGYRGRVPIEDRNATPMAEPINMVEYPPDINA